MLQGCLSGGEQIHAPGLPFRRGTKMFQGCLSSGGKQINPPVLPFGRGTDKRSRVSFQGGGTENGLLCVHIKEPKPAFSTNMMFSSRFQNFFISDIQKVVLLLHVFSKSLLFYRITLTTFLCLYAVIRYLKKLHNLHLAATFSPFLQNLNKTIFRTVLLYLRH